MGVDGQPEQAVTPQREPALASRAAAPGESAGTRPLAVAQRSPGPAGPGEETGRPERLEGERKGGR
jgi:hypothetical protein